MCFAGNLTRFLSVSLNCARHRTAGRTPLSQGRECAGWSDLRFAQSRRLRRCVGVKCRREHVAAPRPEATTAALMGVGLPRHAVYFRPLRGTPSTQVTGGAFPLASPGLKKLEWVTL